jgi:ribose 5-phosphate isomerase B
MQIHIGSDHAGFAYKTLIIEHLKKSDYEVVDHGPFTYEALDDYPTFCLRAAEGVAKNPGALGIVWGGSGMANKLAPIKLLESAQHLHTTVRSLHWLVNTTMQMFYQSASA